MQDHVHHPHDIGERGFLVAEKGGFVKEAPLFGREFVPKVVFNVIEPFDQEAATAGGAIVHGLSRFGLKHFDHCTDHCPRGIKLARVAAVAPHPLQQVFINMRQLKEFVLRLEVQAVDDVEYFAHGVAACNPVIKKLKDVPDFIPY